MRNPKLTSIIQKPHDVIASDHLGAWQSQKKRRVLLQALRDCHVATLLAMTTCLCLTACEPKEKIDKSTTKGEAISMARAIKHEIHAAYLNNYALDANSKVKGLEHLAQSYVLKKWQQNAEYVQEFGYECEKQGFKEFLQQQKLPCEKLNESPIFNHLSGAYEVKCEPEGSYNMWFDYDKKQWNIRL